MTPSCSNRNWEQMCAIMLYRPQQHELKLLSKPERESMIPDRGGGHPDKARRFREAALPYLNDVYTLARYLLRDSADAEDAVQECYLRALRHFDTYRGPAMKPWLFAILRNICRGEFLRRSSAPNAPDADSEDEDAAPLWQE